jgi:hypothetical protein
MTVDDELVLALTRHVAARSGAVLADDIAVSWLKIMRKFAPLIGPGSVLLMFGRSIENNVAAFGWLPVLALPMHADNAVERLRASLTKRKSAEILAAHRAILASFIDLMTTLIGARLTVQFLHAALPAASAGSTTEEKHA